MLKKLLSWLPQLKFFRPDFLSIIFKFYSVIIIVLLIFKSILGLQFVSFTNVLCYSDHFSFVFEYFQSQNLTFLKVCRRYKKKISPLELCGTKLAKNKKLFLTNVHLPKHFLICHVKTSWEMIERMINGWANTKVN